MKQLRGLDALFLYLETPEMPMHVGGLLLFDLPDNYPGDFHDNVKAHFQRRYAPCGRVNRSEMNPTALYTIADRLAQPAGEWKRFDRERHALLTKLLYPDPARTPRFGIF